MINFCLKSNQKIILFFFLWSIWAATWQTNEMSVHPAKTLISLGICPVWSESSLSTWRKLGSLATHWAHRLPMLICIFAGCTHFVGFVMSWLICYSPPLTIFSKALIFKRTQTYDHKFKKKNVQKLFNPNQTLMIEDKWIFFIEKTFLLHILFFLSITRIMQCYFPPHHTPPTCQLL